MTQHQITTIGTPNRISLEEGMSIIKRGLDPMREIYRMQSASAAEMAELAARGARGELMPAVDVKLERTSPLLPPIIPKKTPNPQPKHISASVEE